MGMFQRDSHDRKKFVAARGTSTGIEIEHPMRRFIYSQTNGWQHTRVTRSGGRTHRFSAFHHRWNGRSL